MIIVLLIIIALLLSKIAFGFWVTLLILMGVIASPFVVIMALGLYASAGEIVEMVFWPLRWLDKRMKENNAPVKSRGAALFCCGILQIAIIIIVVPKVVSFAYMIYSRISSNFWSLIEPIVTYLSINYPRIFD